jgi:hypothetical protein
MQYHETEAVERRLENKQSNVCLHVKRASVSAAFSVACSCWLRLATEVYNMSAIFNGTVTERQARWALALFLFLLLAAFPTGPSEAEEDLVDPTAVAERAVGAARWDSAHDDAGKRDLQVQIERLQDGSILGSVTVVGSSYLNNARLEGRVDDKEVYGVLVGTSGQQIGTFSGVVGDSGLSGTYTTIQGDSGAWNWAGQAPVQALSPDANGS